MSLRKGTWILLCRLRPALTPDGRYAVAGSIQRRTINVIDTATDEMAWTKEMDAGIVKFLSAPVPRADSFIGKVEWVQSFLPERGTFALLDLCFNPKDVALCGGLCLGAASRRWSGCGLCASPPPIRRLALSDTVRASN